MKTPTFRIRTLRSCAAALVLLTATPVFATDSYDASSRELTVPALQVGSATFSSLVVTVGSIVTPPSGAAPKGSIDTYDPASRQITVQSVTVSGTTYYNVVATVSGVVSIGGASGVDLYDGTHLTIPAVQVIGGPTYTGAVVTPGAVLSVAGGMPSATVDQYDPVHNRLTVPAVLDQANGRVYTNVVASVSGVASVAGSESSGMAPEVVAAAFEPNGVTTISSSLQGTYNPYLGGSGPPQGGAGGGYTSPNYEFVYIIPTAAQLTGSWYTYQGMTLSPPAGHPFTTAGYNALSFTAQVNQEWLTSANGSANFAVLVTANVGSQMGCVAVAVVAATTASAFTVALPFTAFDYVEPGTCNSPQVTAAEILAGSIIAIDFQAVGGGANFTANGLTTNINTSVLNQHQAGQQNYPTTLTVYGGVSFVSNGPAIPPAITAQAINGAQNGAVIVSLASVAANTTVYYTIDGSTPTTSSTVYSAPFLVASNLTVRAIAAGPGFAPSAVSSRTFTPNIPSGTLVWSDEFTNTTGGNMQPNPAIWTYDTGNSGFGNAELENYCAWGSNTSPCAAGSPNAYVGTDGYLHIVAQQPSPGVYTSARLKTQGLFSFQYGRYEARIAVPEEQGLWPAAWLMGNNIAEVSWPACGEMDMQERIDALLTPDVNYGSIHGPGFTGGAISTPFYFPGGVTAATFHTYGMIWKPGSVSYYIDNPAAPYATYTSTATVQDYANATWPFDSGANFLLLNLAVGGTWPGNPDGTTVFPATTLVDYVRVYAN